jgi:hypothetical protein
MIWHWKGLNFWEKFLVWLKNRIKDRLTNRFTVISHVFRARQKSFKDWDRSVLRPVHCLPFSDQSRSLIVQSFRQVYNKINFPEWLAVLAR